MVKVINYKYILPVLFMEYLSLSLTRSILPVLIIERFGGYSYFVLGLIETVKGLLSFIFCPFFGKMSDTYGRKYLVLISMIGTTLPVCYLVYQEDMLFYSVLVGLSGMFSASFALTFAYISDCVERDQCASAFGLALATFGLSFTIGPALGAFLSASYQHSLVFKFSFALVLLNSLYILFVLPETVQNFHQVSSFSLQSVSSCNVITVGWERGNH
jgi:DHA1 family tetracycline resistance protein-like MFS transporter